MCKVELSEFQIKQLAMPIAKKIDTIISFYENPDNLSRYREWYKNKYGFYPKEKAPSGGNR